MDAGPKDPEQLQTSAGVATIAMKDLRMYHVTRPIDDYKDAIATGRCRITCMDLDGCTLTVANLYGWTWGQIGTYEAERTDDLVAIVRKQFAAMPPGPKAIVGDLNGPIEAFPTLMELIKEEGWTDIGNHHTICEGMPGQYKCHCTDKTKESRIDYIIANDRLTPPLRGAGLIWATIS